MRGLRELLPAALVAGAGGGLALGALRGGHYLAAGFPLMLADTLRREMLGGLVAGALFALLYAAARALLARSGRLREPLAAAAAALPLVALGGYRLDREMGLRPSELLEPHALRINGGYLALCVLAWLAVSLVLVRSAHRVAARWGVAAVTAVALLWGGVAVAFAGTDDPRPDVVLIVVDALRADHLGVYGYPRPTTPALDALAAEGVLFRQAVSQSTFTKSSIASLLTGRNPYQHGVYWGNLADRPGAVRSDLLPAAETTLPEVLAEHGFLTAAWVQNTHLQGFMGFAQGFVDYHDNQGTIHRINARFGRFARSAGRRWATFAYLHYIELHDPYRPEPPYDRLFSPHGGDLVYAGVDFKEWGAYLQAVRRGEVTLAPRDLEELEALYDGQLRHVDDEIGRLLGDLRRAGLYDRSLIVVTSDHGDAFGEHGVISHSTTPYEELVRVPLIVKLPGGVSAGRVIDDPVRLIDVMPTVLAEIGVEAPDGLAGCPLLQPDGLRAPRSGPPCTEAVTEIAEDGAYPMVAVRAGGFKYIHHQHLPDELYDLTRDPGEKQNLAGTGRPEEEPLRRRALAVVEARKALSGETIELDEKTIRELKALGYID